MNENQELHTRMGILHTKHYTWLLQAATNITNGNRLEAEDLIGDLYIFLYKKDNPKLYYKDSFNLMYAYRFFQTRWINKIKKQKKYYSSRPIETIEIEELPYEEMENDLRMMEAYDAIQQELERMATTRDWPKARLFNLYYMSDDTMMDIAKKIGICQSTMFTNIKKVRQHLRITCPNPFQDASK